MRSPQAAARTMPAPKLLLLSAVGLLAWIGVLSVTLGSTASVRHWDVSWIGLDTLEVIGLLGTATLLRLRHRAAVQVGTATATLLVIDAWFDVTLSAPGWAYLLAVLSACIFELPLAVVCLWAARHVTGAGTADG